MAGQSMAIVVLHGCGGGACLVGGCGLVRRVLGAAGGPRSRRWPGPAPTPHARPGGAGGGPCGGGERRRLDTYKNNSAMIQGCRIGRAQEVQAAHRP